MVAIENEEGEYASVPWAEGWKWSLGKCEKGEAGLAKAPGDRGVGGQESIPLGY